MPRGEPGSTPKRSRLFGRRSLGAFVAVSACAAVVAGMLYTASFRVIIPTSNIGPGQPLSPAMFQVRWQLSSGMTAKLVRDLQEIEGKFAVSSIVANKPLARDLITATRPKNQLTIGPPIGFHAVTIPIDGVVANQEWARPGGCVDVVAISRTQGQVSSTRIA